MPINSVTDKLKCPEMVATESLLSNGSICHNNTNKIIEHLAPQKQNTDTDPQHQKTKWATFTYSRKEIRKIFNDAQIKIAFRLQNNRKNSETTSTKRHNKSDIYQTKCLDCPLKYIGQTGRAFHTRNKEHIQETRNNNGSLGYSNHILNTGHKYRIVTDTLDIIRTHRKGKHLTH
jgi:hypothetical protein